MNNHDASRWAWPEDTFFHLNTAYTFRKFPNSKNKQPNQRPNCDWPSCVQTQQRCSIWIMQITICFKTLIHIDDLICKYFQSIALECCRESWITVFYSWFKNTIPKICMLILVLSVLMSLIKSFSSSLSFSIFLFVIQDGCSNSVC